VIDSAVGIGRVAEHLFEFGDETVGLSHIERTKVRGEGLIDEFLVNVEEEGILVVSGGLGIGDKVELVLDDLDAFGIGVGVSEHDGKGRVVLY